MTAASLLRRWGRRWGLKKAGDGALDLLLPPSCVSCGEDIAPGGGAFCADCFVQARRIVDPCCDRCGIPLDAAGYGGRLGICVPCEQVPPVWRSARAAFVYDGWTRRLILPMKYADRTSLAPVLARDMARAGAGLLERATLLVPVPMYRLKLWQRRYNQAALLARVLSGLSAQGSRSVPVLPDALARSRPTRALARLTPAQRRREIEGAIAVRPERAGRIAGQAVLLVDDVLTTGATAASCARALLNAGAQSVDILVAARAESSAR